MTHAAFGGPRNTIVQLVLAKASADPRNALNGCHHNVLAMFESEGRKVTLRHFSFETPDAHRYRDTQRACSLSCL